MLQLNQNLIRDVGSGDLSCSMSMEGLQHRAGRHGWFTVGSSSDGLQQLFGVLKITGVKHGGARTRSPVGGITRHGVICHDELFGRWITCLRLPNSSAGFGIALPG